MGNEIIMAKVVLDSAFDAQSLMGLPALWDSKVLVTFQQTMRTSTIFIPGQIQWAVDLLGHAALFTTAA